MATIDPFEANAAQAERIRQLEAELAACVTERRRLWSTLHGAASQPLAVPSARNPVGVVAFAILTTVAVMIVCADVAWAIQRRSVVAAGLGLVVLGLAVLGAYEAWSLTGAGVPITWLERWAHARHQLAWPLMTLLVGLGEGLLAGHFWWSTCP